MPYRRIILSLLFWLPLTAAAAKSHRDTVRISEFGLAAGTYRNATPVIKAALDACKELDARVLLFDEGRYDIWTDGAQRREWFISNTSSEQECPSKVKTVGVLVEDMHDLTIDGCGAELIFHGSMITFGVVHSSNITLRNMRIDFARPAMTEFTIVGHDPTGTTVEFHPDSSYDIGPDGRIHLIGEGWQTNTFYCTTFDPATERCEFTWTWDKLMKAPATAVAPRRVKFATTGDFKPAMDKIYVVRDYIRDHVGMFLAESRDIELDALEVNYMNGIGIVGQYTRNITLRNVQCIPHPGSGRIMAASADFSHFSGCSGRIRVLDSKFSGAQDDPINVHGTNLRIIERRGDNRLLLMFMHGQSYGFNAFTERDTVAIVNAETMERSSYAVVKRVKKVSERTVELTLDRKIPQELVIKGNCVENISATPEVEIRRCMFTHTHTRGTLVTTPRRVVIADNVYARTGMSAILIEGDAEGWYESGPVCDVTIENNWFYDCGYVGGPANAVIAIHPSNTVIDPERPVHRNIRILNNRFFTTGNPLVYAKSTQGLVFKGNSAEVADPQIYRVPMHKPREAKAADLADGTSNEPFVLVGCKDVRIENNNITGYPAE